METVEASPFHRVFFESESLLKGSSSQKKHRRALIAAFKHSYCDLPRKIDSEQLAKRSNIRRSTSGAPNKGRAPLTSALCV
jgi:hypothetical protein